MNSLKTRFIFIILFILASLSVLLWNDIRMLNQVDAQKENIVKIKNLHIAFLQIRKHEKDFLARKNMKYHAKLMHIAHAYKEQFIARGLDVPFKNYIDTFESITAHMQTLGLDDSQGFKAEFILHTNRLEKDLTEDNHTDILIEFLMMRKHEKDFFIHRTIKSLKLRRQMIKDIKNHSSLKAHTDILLDNYNLAFINLKTLMLTIGLNETVGLHGEMRQSAHAIEQDLINYIDKTIPQIQKNVSNLYLTRYIIYFFILVLVFVLFAIFLKPIYRAFNYFKNFFHDFEDASQRVDLKKIRFDELQNVADIVNTMLENREHIEINLVKAKDEALNLQKVKDQFLTNMSHELRTPLNAIIGFSTILKNKIPNESEIITPIQESSKNLLSIINDILDISKIQSGKFTIYNETFNLKERLDACLDTFNYDKKKNINFTINSHTDDTLNLSGDWLRISQVITNFLSNAFKFTPDNGNITLNVHFAKFALHISVSDSGIGISKEAMQRVLKPFEQADSTTTKDFGGTGLGLSICSSLIEMMGGKIKIDSKEGQGATFSFSIPLEEIEENYKAEMQIIHQDQDELAIAAHILIVEDNKTNQMLLGMLLEDAGITFDVANDGLEAVQMYEEDKYDMVLMDENMPNLNGVEAMLKIREEHSKVSPIIAVTANVMKGDEKRLLDAGMNGFVAKPIDDDELYSTIRKFLHLNELNLSS